MPSTPEGALCMVSALLSTSFLLSFLFRQAGPASKKSVMGGLALVASKFTAASAAAIPRQRLANVFKSCTVPNTVALTFDDGPYIWHKGIVDMLDAAGAKGTFFMNGYNYGCVYSNETVDQMEYSYSRGHQIASHTWGHAHLSDILDEAQMERQFELSDTAFSKILGVVPTFMRPPYGEYSDLVLKVAADHNQNVIIWDVDSGDSVGATAEQSKQTYLAAVDSKASNVLTLNHETHQSSAEDVLPFAIKTFQAKGYRLVTVAECLGYKARDMYQRKTKPAVRDDTWTCDGTPGPGQS
ncbi:carbohydrate esterase family 4 protein [Botryobasidium botryosum FD-172 SS1]|uniref:Carbohydrate esterase family 4 protein n=1 Tax=Botryobasidium botryosum (strain FD-172 SS1) TaxID=930990 RepID=A0A067N3D7_BOTB1|nr:carbohydrate esterase family 4 protein [Botryobasidium botryosum FD-172 SS1]